ncbi:MAG TPA: UDP-N-acetylglucosamine 2-epimerase (non-hydrolyzing) [Bacteroidales bacterium]|nr:UDP-N-acetylglucosamine 2-epimerase (non-hydrolyzing) [Bacteroidales bacterium]
MSSKINTITDYQTIRLTLVAGARPNFMKVAPVIKAIKKLRAEGSAFDKSSADKAGLRAQGAELSGRSISYRLVHTGQHYDRNMSDTFFTDLNIPEPDVNLGCGGGTQAEQTAAIMIAFEKELMANPADLVIVVGDVTSTMACTIVAKKLNTKVAHIEAGIRSFDMTMPEEINRMVTDTLADYFFTTSELAGSNLRKAGIPDEKIFFVGNVMIDTLLANRKNFRKPAIWDEQKLEKGNYLLVTLHRPNNVDDPAQLKALIDAIIGSSHGIPVIFPVHPRTAQIINKINNTHHSLLTAHNFVLTEPLGYLEFNYLMENAKAVITDSGGITEETTVFGIPCITIRNSTERPETVTIGTNELIGTDPEALKPVMERLFEGKWKKGGIPELWDGRAAERIIEVIMKLG